MKWIWCTEMPLLLKIEQMADSGESVPTEEFQVLRS